MEIINSPDYKYHKARKRVKKIKNFIIFTAMFILVLLYSIISKLSKGQEWDLSNLWGFGFWAFGLVVFGASIFLPDLLFSSKWEQRKIKEIMEKNMR